MVSSTNGGIKKRVYMHYKSLKGHITWVKDRDCEETHDYDLYGGPYPHMHGHYETTTPNHVWLHLARIHKMRVREIKDIVTEMRKAAKNA